MPPKDHLSAKALFLLLVVSSVGVISANTSMFAGFQLAMYEIFVPSQSASSAS
jgi:hypothetical protein